MSREEYEKKLKKRYTYIENVPTDRGEVKKEIQYLDYPDKWYYNSEQMNPIMNLPNMKDIFRNEENTHYLIRIMIGYNNKYGNKDLDPITIADRVAQYQDEFLFDPKFSNFKSVTNDWTVELDYINKHFFDKYKEYLKYGDKMTLQQMEKELLKELDQKIDFNPYRHEAYIHGKGKVKYKDMTVYDIRALDVWKPQQITADSSKFRYNNEIPSWRRSLHRRHFDVANDGLRYTPYSSSREVPIRGYNMKEIIDASEKYKKKSWGDLI